MEVNKIEFWVTPEGKVRYRKDGEDVEREFSAGCVEYINLIYNVLERYFPKALEALEALYGEKYSTAVVRYMIVERFIRCNFGAHDYMHFDYDHGMFSFEEVICPLRGRCEHEGIICKPQISTRLGDEELRSAILYAEGKFVDEIGVMLGKAEKTIYNQLENVKKKLGLQSTKQIPGVMHRFCMFDNVKSLMDQHKK